LSGSFSNLKWTLHALASCLIKLLLTVFSMRLFVLVLLIHANKQKNYKRVRKKVNKLELFHFMIITDLVLEVVVDSLNF